jgi:hypothetical protein
MYDDRFGTDWTELTPDEALKRMFALGLAAGLGESRPEERDRLLELADSAYDRSVLELSYREGEAKAEGARPGRDEADVWAEALEEEFDDEGVDVGAGGSVSYDTPEGVPSAVERSSFLNPSTDELERLRPPKMLRRDG